jgi:hypothetical protein
MQANITRRKPGVSIMASLKRARQDLKLRLQPDSMTGILAQFIRYISRSAPLPLLLCLSHLSQAAAVGGPENGSSNWAPFVETNFPFISSTLDARMLGAPFPSDNLTVRGIILNLGHDCWACFDTDLLRVSALWIGKGITAASMSQISYHSPGTKTVEGEEHLPRIIGTPLLACGLYAGWQAVAGAPLVDTRDRGPDPKELGRGPISPDQGRFNALRLTEKGLQIEYQVGTSHVIERIEARLEGETPVIQRTLHLDKVAKPLALILGQKAAGCQIVVESEGPADPTRRGIISTVDRPDGVTAVQLSSANKPLDFKVAFGFGKITNWNSGDIESKARFARSLWPEQLRTQGSLSSGREAYVTDNISLPVQNPWQRNIRLADLAFFQNGRAAAVTFDGDVWIIDGLDADLHEVQWRRFASGLNEPMGLCIRDNQLYVCDRNGIWRLRDLDNNGEADLYEMFSNVYGQSAETREYAQGIRCAPDGSFVIAKGGIQMTALGKHNGTVLRISPDGKTASVLGYGFRSPFIGVNPNTGLVTASDQQGNYVPTTPIHIVRDRQFYGFLSVLQPKEKYPAPIADPITWIPYPINASGAGQVWVTGDRMGPLNGTLIHIAYYRPEIFSVLLNERGSQPQGGVVSITRDLEFAPLNGAINPVDGQLYITGFQIFGTTAKQISGLARVRYTGAPCTLPQQVIATDKGFLIRFGVRLDPKHAFDIKNFSTERWNYLRTSAYGSPHFKLDGSKGQESLLPTRSYLSRDGKSLFLAIPGMKSVMQMRLGSALATQDGIQFEQNIYLTPRELTAFNPTAEGFDAFTVDLTPVTGSAASIAPATIDEGRRIAELMGCAVCHSTDGTVVGKAGPTWRGLFESKQLLSDGTNVTADETYLRESIREPAAKLVRGYEKSETAMPSYDGVLSDGQIESLILYIKSLKQVN